jgi:hypothetical protein
MKRRFVQIEGELVEVPLNYTPEPRADTHIIPDIEPFKANDGAVIRGRAHWRDHLKATGTVEMGHSDVRAMEAVHAKKKAAHAERIRHAQEQAKPVEVQVTEAKVDHTRIAARVAERLEGRPTPPRTTLIKIALEEARRLRR